MIYISAGASFARRSAFLFYGDVPKRLGHLSTPLPLDLPHPSAGLPDSQESTGDWSGWSCNGSEPTTSQPILAYVNRAQLSLIRQNLFRIVPGPMHGDRANTPVSRLQQLRSKLLVPEDVDHDAHFVGIMLAMATGALLPRNFLGTIIADI